MNELLKKDIAIKTISILFAVVLWFYVLDGSNPFGRETLYVSARVINENTLQDKGLVLKTKTVPKVGIKIKGRREVMNNISVNDFEVVLDLSKVKDDQTKELRIEEPVYIGKGDISDVSIEDVTPRVIKIELEKIEKNHFHVDLETQGTLKENYKIISQAVEPENVAIEALDSVLKSIGNVKAVVDVNNLDKNLFLKKECKVFDRNGKEIPGLSKNLNVYIKIQVAKEVPIRLTVKGTPAKDYIDGVQKVKPQKALIEGPPEVLDKIHEIQTESVDIQNMTQSINKYIRLVLPKGIELFDTPAEVQANIVIEQLARKEFTIKKDRIKILNAEMNNPLKYELKTESIVISIKGKWDHLEKIDIEDLEPSIDVGGLGEGTSRVPLKFNLPPTVKLMEDQSVDVVISKNQGET
ncbi:MAG: CdaR family protein [Clostridia bacterium]|nr:CdaR family protein [Clostridia bacterium]